MPFPADFDPSRIPEEAWEHDGYSGDGLRRYSIAWVDREKGLYVRRTENLAEPEILAANERERNDTDGTRWSSGMGSDKGGNLPMVKVASVPLNVFFRDIAPRQKEGDTDFVKWWLRNEQNRPYRTRRGNV